MDVKLAVQIMQSVLIGSLILNVFYILTLMWTPALSYLIARIARRPLIHLHHPDNLITIKTGSRPVYGLSNVKGHGPIICAKGTGVFDMKSKVMIYNVLTENAETQPLYKAALVKELRALGFKMLRYRDMKLLLRILKDDDYVKQKLLSFKKEGKNKAQRWIDFVRMVRSSDIELNTKMPYKFNELCNMFGDDMNSAAIETANQIAIAQDRKTRNINVMVWGMAALFVFLGAGIAYMIIQGQQPPEIVVTLADQAARNATATVIRG